MAQRNYRIASIPADGIGTEVISASASKISTGGLIITKSTA